MTRGSRSLGALVAAVVACGPRVDPDIDATSSGAGSSGAGTTIALEGDTTSTGTTAAADTSTSTSCGLPSPEPPPELPTCDAERTPEASVAIDGVSPKDSDELLPCTVETITTARGSGVVVELTCSVPELGVTPVRLDISSDGVSTLPISTGSEVLLGYAGGGLFDEILLTLRRADQSLVLVWIDAGWLPTPEKESIPSASFLDPIAVDYAPENCGYECDPGGGGGCSFIEDPCPCISRLAIDVRVGDAMQRIVDGGRASVGEAFDVHVVSAARGGLAADGGSCGALDVFPWVRLLAVAAH